MDLPVTYLFVPADRPDRFAKALASGADRVILDLEDAVRPEAKPEARQAIREATLDWARVVIRVNPAGSDFFADDLALLRDVPAAAVLLPKAEDMFDIAAVRAAAGQRIEVLPQIETARGLDRLDALLGAEGVARAVFGHLDYAIDIGAEPVPEALLHARQTLVWRSRVAGRAAPVDSVTPEIDTTRVAADAEAARRMGFGAKLLIHPAQVAPCAAAFAPSEADIGWARRVLDAVAQGGSGAIALDARMIDKPVEEAARRILARAQKDQE